MIWSEIDSLVLFSCRISPRWRWPRAPVERSYRLAAEVKPCLFSQLPPDQLPVPLWIVGLELKGEARAEAGLLLRGQRAEQRGYSADLCYRDNTPSFSEKLQRARLFTPVPVGLLVTSLLVTQTSEVGKDWCLCRRTLLAAIFVQAPTLHFFFPSLPPISKWNVDRI